MVILISYILLFLSFSAKWIMDTLQFHFDESVFKKLPNQDFWNPILSWKNKYVDKDTNKGFKSFCIKIPYLTWNKKSGKI